jgi:hypothetical protein
MKRGCIKYTRICLCMQRTYLNRKGCLDRGTRQLNPNNGKKQLMIQQNHFFYIPTFPFIQSIKKYIKDRSIFYSSPERKILKDFEASRGKYSKSEDSERLKDLIGQVEWLRPLQRIDSLLVQSVIDGYLF